MTIYLVDVRERVLYKETFTPSSYRTKIDIMPLDTIFAKAAAKSWMKYLKRKEKIKCPQCGHKMIFRAHFLSDFFIGGFASSKCDAILTRDRGIYKKYFPDLVGYENCFLTPPQSGEGPAPEQP